MSFVEKSYRVNNAICVTIYFLKKDCIGFHDKMGHMGMDRTLAMLQSRFFWPRMSNDVRIHIRSCDQCMRFKQLQEREEMSPIETTYPLELVHLDFLTIGQNDRTMNVLVVTDHFTRYAQAFVTPKQTAAVTAKTLWENYLVHYGWPASILTDQGRSFENNLIKELCSIAGVGKIRTSPYRPETNGQCERLNQTLINMIGTLSSEDKQKWPEWVSTLTHAYNCIPTTVTGYSPYFLMFGRHPRLPIDLEYGVTQPELTSTSVHNYAKKLKTRLQWAYDRALHNNWKESRRQKKYYDCKFRCMKLAPDDIVIVRIKAFGLDHKIADKWKETPYRVLSQLEGQPAYRIQEIDSEGTDNIKVLHRNMLFPLLTLQSDVTSKQTVLVKANMLMDLYFS